MAPPTGGAALSRITRVGLVALAFGLAAPLARADNRLGGHFGAVVAPLVSSKDNSSIFDNFSIGFPMGITVKKSDKFAFDLEIVASIDSDPLSTGLTIHPGVLWGLSNNFTFGLRFAIDVTGDAWGFTPLLNKGFPYGGYTLFAEAVAPIRFSQDVSGDNDTTIGLGIHVGIGL